MVTFTDIVKEQRQQGAGVFSSLGKAAGQRTLERIDPRNYLFKRSGLLTALFPGLKGYQAGGTKDDSTLKSSTTSLSSGQVELIVDKLDELKDVQQETAKNTLVLPLIARDMNVMRQNILKLVKLSGGKPSSRADSFFLSAKQREEAYESKFGKKSPTAVSDKKDEKEKSRGLLSFLGGTLFTLFKGLVSGIFSLFASLIPSLLGLFTGLIGTIGRITGSILTSLLGPAIRVLIGSLSSLFLPLLRVLGPIVVVIGAMKLAMEALNKIFEFFTGKSSKYATEKYDKNTPEDIKKLIDKEFEVESEERYKNAEKIIKTGRGFLGLPLSDKEIADAKKIVEDADKLRNFKMADDYQRYRRDVLGNTEKYSKGEKRPTFEEYKNSQRSPSSLNSTSMSGSLDEDMANLIREKFKAAGFSDIQAEAAVANAIAESNLNPNAHNTRGEDSVGLFQMNRDKGLGVGYSVEQLKDPNTNIDLAIAAAKNSKDFKSASTIDEAVAAFVKDVERPANQTSEIYKRTQIALNREPSMQTGMTLTSAASAVPSMNDIGKMLNQGSTNFESMVREFLASSGMVNINNDSSTKVSTTNASQDGPPGSAYDTEMFTAMVDSAVNY